MAKNQKRRSGKSKSAKKGGRKRADKAKGVASDGPFAISRVVTCVADTLRANGAEIAPRVLDIMSATTTFLSATGNVTDGEVVAASHLAAQLRTDDAKRAAAALGIAPDLIPTLSPAVVDIALVQVLARGTMRQAVVAAAVIFCLHAIAARAGNASRAEALKGAARTATLQGSSQNPTLAQALFEEMGKVPLSARPAIGSSDYLFSISIDLVGSTDAKTRVMRLANGDRRKIDELNEQIYREFCRIERRFYEGAVSQYGTTAPIDLAKFFTVKGIGDEIWILCDVSAADVLEWGTV
jgi:hypothetical protein